jgi:hypothetical protein
MAAETSMNMVKFANAEISQDQRTSRLKAGVKIWHSSLFSGTFDHLPAFPTDVSG